MDKHDMQRRRILYGMLTAGCAASVPMLFVGCERQEAPPPEPKTSGGAQSPAPTTDNAAAGSGAAEDAAENAPENIGAGKMSQAQARYQDQPSGDQQCSNCSNFIAEDNTCKTVQGQVSPQGWCVLWVKLA
jgi:hypothetical protein